MYEKHLQVSIALCFTAAKLIQGKLPVRDVYSILQFTRHNMLFVMGAENSLLSLWPINGLLLNVGYVTYNQTTQPCANGPLQKCNKLKTIVNSIANNTNQCCCCKINDAY